jgi:hypothetical protein
MTATIHRLPMPVGSREWWDSPHSPAELAQSIERFVAEHGEGATIEVGWLYRTADRDELRAFVDECVQHVHLRDLWLHDPRHAADELDLPLHAVLAAEVEAERHETELRDLITWWTTTHPASRP